MIQEIGKVLGLDVKFKITILGDPEGNKAVQLNTFIKELGKDD